MFTLNELAKAVDGDVLGEGAIEVKGIAPFEHAGPQEITFAEEKKLIKRLDSTRALAVIVSKEVESAEKPLLRVANPKLAFARIVALFYPRQFSATGISELTSIGQDCRIAENVSVHPQVSIGNRVEIGERVTLYPGVAVGDGCRIGIDCTLFPNVTLYSGVSVGDRITIHSGSVIGADGFGYVFDGERQVKLPQVGVVEIQDDVEIGANTCIDRATFGATVIERGVKIDNLVQIAHNCRVGENTVICGSVGISGSVTIGKNCILAGGVGVRDHVKIGDGVIVYARTGVDRDIPAGSRVSGYMQQEHRTELKTQALVRQLPTLYEEIRELRRKVDGIG